jgi:hypothetical protein
MFTFLGLIKGGLVVIHVQIEVPHCKIDPLRVHFPAFSTTWILRLLVQLLLLLLVMCSQVIIYNNPVFLGCALEGFYTT